MTTDEEKEAFIIVKSILRETVDAKKVVMRDQQTYCGVLFEDNNRKPLCRLYFNSSNKQIGLFDNDERKENKVPVAGLDDIFKFADRLKATAKFYIK